MKTITFLTKTRQLYYHIKKSDNERCMVLILLKKPTKLYYNGDRKNPKLSNVIGDCNIDKKDISLIDNLMKSNTLAVQHLNNHINDSVNDLAQLKVSYGSEIKQWPRRWKIKN